MSCLTPLYNALLRAHHINQTWNVPDTINQGPYVTVITINVVLSRLATPDQTQTAPVKPKKLLMLPKFPSLSYFVVRQRSRETRAAGLTSLLHRAPKDGALWRTVFS